MVKPIRHPKNEKEWKKEMTRVADEARKRGDKATPFPTELTKPEDWLKINARNVLKYDPAVHSVVGLPLQQAFKDSKMFHGAKVYSYLSFMIQNAPKKKRLAERNEEKEQKKLRGLRPYDPSLFPNPAARRAAMIKFLWNADKKEVTMDRPAFEELGGNSHLWNELYAKQKAAKVEEARAADRLRRTKRKPSKVERYDPVAAATRAGASPHDDKYPKFGVKADEAFIETVVKELRDLCGALGVDWVCEAWQSETCLELKLRGLMAQVSRILTIGAVTTQVHVQQALAALQRELRKRLAAWYATLPKAGVRALGEATNCDVASAPAACAAALAAGGADVRVDAATRAAAQTARGGAASALGGDAELPPMHVVLAAAATHRLDLDRLVLDANANVLAGEQRFADGAPADSTATRGADHLTNIARRASANLDKHAVRAALDDEPLGDTPFGRLGLVLLRLGLVTFDAAGKAVPGAAIERMAASYSAMEGTGTTYFDIHKVVLVAVHYAFINKLLDFERMQLSLFQCVFGRYILALWAWLNGLTASDFEEMKLELGMVPLEFDDEELALLSDDVAKAFAGGVEFETAADLLKTMQKANELFAALKNSIFGEAKVAYNNGAAAIVSTLLAAGAEASRSVVTRGSTVVAMEVDDAEPLSAEALRAAALALDGLKAGLAKLCGGNEEKGALARFCDATLKAPAVGSVLALVDAALAIDDPTSIKRATRIVAKATAAEPRFDLDTFLKVVIETRPPSEMMFECDVRFHKPGVGGYTDWRSIKDFYSVYAALKVHSSWGSAPAWLGASPTCCAFETSGQQTLPGLRLKEMTKPKSVCSVFDREECEGTKYGTYTIFIGSDYQLRVRGRAPVDKCACLVEAVKAYMASRAAV